MALERFKNPIAAYLHQKKVTADFLTYLGVFLAFVSGVHAARGFPFFAALFILASGVCDLLDGAVARLSGNANRFGGILDSHLDRYGDAFVLGGLVFFYAAIGRPLYVVLGLTALAGAFQISYVRARSECVIDGCRVGFWERGERLVFIALAGIFNNFEAALWVLALGTHWTATQRLIYARSVSFSKPAPRWTISSERNQPYYALKIMILVALLILFRPELYVRG